MSAGPAGQAGAAVPGVTPLAVRRVTATRYVTPLREGGSLPAIVEADDDGLYVLKFRGAGQGRKALIAELVAGELARAAGLPVPEIVLIELDVDLARTEPDPEIQDLIRASGGLNLALDYLPGSVSFDPLAFDVDADLAAGILWLDALTGNVDRTVRNTNLLIWHGRPWMIDHGAALTFHHDWAGHLAADLPRGFGRIGEHVLLRAGAARIAARDAQLARALSPEVVDGVLALIPDSWLEGEPAFGDVATHRAAYRRFLTARLVAPRQFVEEALRVAAHV